MKNFIITITILITSLSLAQNTGSISGNIQDLEENLAPLMMAKVTIKETGDEILTDDRGNFKFENLKEGTYTLVSSFVGYETKEMETMVVSDKINHIKVQLAASSISLDDLMLVMAKADNSKDTSVLKN